MKLSSLNCTLINDKNIVSIISQRIDARSIPTVFAPLILYQTKTLHWSNFKAFLDDKFNDTENTSFVSRDVENIVGKSENVSYQFYFSLPTPLCFRFFPFRVVKKRNCL